MKDLNRDLATAGAGGGLRDELAAVDPRPILQDDWPACAAPLTRCVSTKDWILFISARVGSCVAIREQLSKHVPNKWYDRQMSMS